MPKKCPELELQPDLYYNEREAEKYTRNSRIIEVQTKLSERALELCNLSPDKKHLVLDIGCGSCLSGEVIEAAGHAWFGLDISAAMLEIAQSRDYEGSLVLGDMGDGLPFRAGVFDACISISALQWLCNSYCSDQIPSVRLMRFFRSLYACLANGSPAILQFYPQSHQQVELITNSALKAGFSGGLVVDYPESTRAKKLFLCLYVGIHISILPQGKTLSQGSYVVKHSKLDKRKAHSKKSKAWINAKKESRAKKGFEVRPYSKYTGRRRKPKI